MRQGAVSTSALEQFHWRETMSTVPAATQPLVAPPEDHWTTDAIIDEIH